MLNPMLLKKEYLVQVQIIEARQICGKDSSGTSDVFIKITVADQPPQVTRTAPRTNSAIWNQSFTFTNIFLTDIDLENFEILIEMIDKNQFLSNSLIGSYSIGLATLYRSKNHEFFSVWLTMMNPSAGPTPQGYLLISCYIIGSQDNPPVHGINEIVYFEDDPDGNLPEDELTPQQLRDRRERGNRPAVLDNPMINQRSYQLNINIAKVEDLKPIGKSCDPFISVRCVGEILCTQVAENTQKPVFNTRLQFPVVFPLMHEKIVMRIWDKNRFGADDFIARIPEKPEDNEFFNITSLQSRGGTMAFRWINLYGIPGNERKSAISKLFNSKKTLLEGTEFMGRVLMSMTLAYAEKPTRSVMPLQSFREPISQEYTLRVDVYELQEAQNCGDQVWVRASIGPNAMISGRAAKASTKVDGAKVEIPKTYRWKSKRIMIDDIVMTYPVDPLQVPDIILAVHTNTFMSDRRVSYVRIPANDQKIQDDQAPQWYKLKNVENNVEDTEYGYLLANVVLKPTSAFKGTRMPKRRDITIPYLFIAYIYGGYDLAPEYQSDDIETKVEIKIAPEKPFGPKETKKGKYPIWDKLIPKIINLDENLEFASKIVVSLSNQKQNRIMKAIRDPEIGNVIISPLDCPLITKFDDYEFGTPKYNPKFYHITKDGQSKGRILASFALLKNPRDADNIKKYEKKAQKDLKSRMKLKKFKAKVNLSVFGIRNLPFQMKKPVVTLNIPQRSGSFLTTSFSLIEKYPTYAATKNPDILEILTIDDVELTEDPLYLPVAEITVSEQDSSKKFFMSVPLFEYAQEWQKTTRLYEVGQLFYVGLYDNGTKKEKVETEKKDAGKNENKDKKDDAGRKTAPQLTTAKLLQLEEEGKKNERGTEILSRLIEKSAEKEIAMNKKQMELEDDHPVVLKQKNSALTKEKTSALPNERNTAIYNEKKSAMLKSKRGDDTVDDIGGDISTAATDMRPEDEELLPIMPNFRLDGVKTLECTKVHKDQEEKERKAELDGLKKEIQELRNDPKSNPEEITEKVSRAQKIAASRVDAKIFYGSDGRIGEDYDYGRPIQKEPMENLLALPYIRYELYETVTFGRSCTMDLSGFVRSGVLSGAVFKGALQIIPTTEINRVASTNKSKKSHYIALGKKRIDKDEDPIFWFNIFDPDFLAYFREDKYWKVRVYLLRGLNLSAQEDATEIKDLLAGMSALASANSYPVIVVGDGKNRKNAGYDVLKTVNDRVNTVTQNLNPNYFRPFELDVKLPDDWQLQIHIFDSKTIRRDTLIGSTSIDLEDRLIGDPIKKQMIVYEALQTKWEAELKYEEQKEFDSHKVRELRAKIGKAATKKESLKADPSPVEYRALRNPGKNTSQGTIEIFIEVLEAEIARSLPFAKIEPPQPQLFEMRLVIYETFDIPRGPNGVVDAFVRVTLLSSEGWTGEDVNKDTDVHYGSSDGHGMFNWRMKFPLKVPSSYPRLKLAVFDANVFGSDEAIGARAISLKRNIKKLMSEGKYVSLPGKIDLYHPNHPNESRGQILMSLTIIPQSEAEGKPVGEAQEEPNRDPYLERPTEGRGVGDFLKGTAFGRFSFPAIGRLIKIILGIIIAVVLILILFIKPGILVK